MRKAKITYAGKRRAKTTDRLQPKDKHGKDSWKKRNKARQAKQEAFKAAQQAVTTEQEGTNA